MSRICSSLANNGYLVTLVGIQKKTSAVLQTKKYNQKRIRVWVTKGPFFYAEYNIKLFFYLLFSEVDAYCCIDLDTILPNYFASILKRKKRIYDAHEYFSQLKEIISRPIIYSIWNGIEKWLVPKFTYGYTVSESIAVAFKRKYNVQYETIRNVPYKKDFIYTKVVQKNIVYQGMVNEGRGFEGLIPAMKNIDAMLMVYGHGNFFEQTKRLIAENNVENKVILKGKYLPVALNEKTAESYIGINLVENTGLNQYYSLANKFFDYIQNGVPQITMNFPEYKKINDRYSIAILIDDINPETIAVAVNNLLNNEITYNQLKENCKKAAADLTWQNEEIKLLGFYKKIFDGVVI